MEDTILAQGLYCAKQHEKGKATTAGFTQDTVPLGFVEVLCLVTMGLGLTCSEGKKKWKRSCFSLGC